jgi:hypothetical protein
MKSDLFQTTQFSDALKFRFGDWQNAQPIAALEQSHFGKGRSVAESFQGNEVLKVFGPLDIHQHPAGIFGGGFDVLIFTAGLELRGVGVRTARDFHYPGDARLGATAVVEKG